MEVHHHPDVHHKRKNFKEYFLEFLMIFLAVTMGFFAETIREGISEDSKAKELAESLYKEAYADSVNMQNKLSLRLEKEEQMSYFREYILDSNLTDLSERFYPSFAWTAVLTTSIIFEPNDGELSQLRNSGALRFFKSTHLQNCISHINVAISNIRDRNGEEYRFIEEFVRPFVLKYYDFKWMDTYTQNGKLSILQALSQANFHSSLKPVIRNIRDLNREDAGSIVAYYLLVLRATRQIHYRAYVEKNHELLETLRKEYHF
ncbi:MAG TPA: hypothetical protein VK787_00815 [Puia sp.]|jgi:hypothetical protein|nr:hypothetical protein [Puia sp.]